MTLFENVKPPKLPPNSMESCVKFDTALIADHRRQRTLGKVVSLSGVGLHSGKKVTITFKPANADTGVVFCRIDLPNHPVIPANVKYARESVRCTSIGVDETVVHTVEHVLAALAAHQIDNLVIEISEREPPAAGGCATPYLEMIDEAGVVEQEKETPRYRLRHPIHFSHGETHIVAVPSDHYQVSYTVDYPKVPAIRSQYCSVAVNLKTFREEIAPCRTFALYEEIKPLIEAGLAQGGNLENAVVIKGDEVLNEGGLRFPNEMVRHKVLDLIGDLSLVGSEFLAHVIAIRTSHQANVAFARELYNHLMGEKTYDHRCS